MLPGHGEYTVPRHRKDEDETAWTDKTQSVGRSTLGNQGTNQDIGIKYDPHVRRPFPRRLGRGWPVGLVGRCGP